MYEKAIEIIVERQKVISSDYTDSDVLALARSDGDACVQVFFIRGGKLIGRDYFLLEGATDTPDADVMAGFVKQFYNQASTVPSQVVLPQDVEEVNIIRQWLSQRRDDQMVEIVVPRDGPQQELIRMAAENAAETLRSLQAQWQVDRHRQEQALAELQQALGLSPPIGRIECYDTGVDTRVSDVFTNVSNDNVDNNHNGLVDAADTRSPENQFKRSLVSTCNNCHQNHLYHNGSIGGVNGQASCLDCHDPHGKGVSRSPTDNNTYMIRTSVIGKATVFKSQATDSVKDYYRNDGTCFCDNPNCHAKPLGPKGTSGTIMEDVPEHRNNPQVVPGSDCSQCHSHTSATASFVPNCAGCHDYTGQPHTVGAHVLSPVHDRHYKAFADNGYAFECFQCHSNNIHNESNMSDKSQWGTSISHLTISNNVDVIFDNPRNPGTDNSSYSPAKLSRTTPGAGTCSGLTCHGANLPAGAKGEDQMPTWNQPSSGACGSCHRVYTSAQKMATGTHTEHADNVSGYGFGCNVCHYQTTTNGLTIDNTSTARALHLDNSSEVTFNTADWRFSAGPTYTGTLIVGDAT